MNGQVTSLGNLEGEEGSTAVGEGQCGQRS